MAKLSAKESRTRPKQTAVVETISASIAKLRELSVQVEDLRQEGFPYRDAVRARVELHVRECAKLVFPERSPELQQWKHYRVRATSPAEVTETLAHLHDLAAQLDRRKLELLGIAPPISPSKANAAGTLPQPIPAIQPVTQPMPASREPASAPPPAADRMGSPVLDTTTGALHSPVSTVTPEARTPPDVPTPPAPPAPVPNHPHPPIEIARGPQPSQSQASAPQISSSPAPPPTVTRPAAPIAPDSREQDRAAIIQAEAPAAAPRPLSPPPTSPAPSPLSIPEPAQSQALHPLPPDSAKQEVEPLDVIRKVCTRFHTIARQLRLRREYRPTLDVDDDRDVQDLLYALLRYELDEVAPHEWTPSYQTDISSLALVMPRQRLAIVGKKTKSGIGPREIAQQLTLDGREFSPTAGYLTLVCFVYDPEGRLGNPRGLEAELTKVSDTQIVEVIIFPK